MAAEMFAAARGFGIAGGAVLARRQNDVRILAKWGQTAAVWNFERETWKLRVELFVVSFCDTGSQRLRKLRQVCFKLRAENRGKSSVEEMGFIQRRVEAACTKMGRRILRADCWKPLESEPR